MATVPRKLLIVKRDPPDTGYNIMLEVDDRTMSYQVPDSIGEAVMVAAQAAIIDILVQRGLR